eukprot:CAMPEP_0182508682 /NCGR_PEP_ID=MMETSP1321-20130603/25476_1 /TAXON_ID=91990 /ORGANISM="Bolidomonas sp., Strain RCC1657" /LENGTH=482 /DNA_ID=CAMNT_0024714795 /DNA_START=74 /DNA_END=1519 /DNA_ORIENTATION=-
MSAAAKPQHVTESSADRRKARELQAARAAGSAAPAVDIKSGQMINPHNPEFITKKPWYLGGDSTGPTLDHQAAGEVSATLTMSVADSVAKSHHSNLKQKIKSINKTGQGFEVNMWVEALKKNKRPYLMAQVLKVSKRGELDLKYEDGTFESQIRPSNGRVKATKVNATLSTATGEHGKLDYASKRDKYYGYDNEDYKGTVRRYEEREELRRKIREEEKQKQKLLKTSTEGEATTKKDTEFSDSDDSEDDEEIDKEGQTFTTRLGRQGGVGGAQMKVTARNLRIREDTAKYLRNLDPNSAYYDPKSRSMRDNPNPEINPNDLQFAGDNFVRYTGEAADLAKTQLFAWDAQDKGSDIHAQANPSQAEMMKKKVTAEKESTKGSAKKKVLDKYGGSEFLKTDSDRSTLFSASSTSKLFSRDGRLLKGGETSFPVKTKYSEDVHPNGHACVWGSYFHSGAFRWGWRDDHSLLKSGYYTGVNGRKAN